MLGAGLHTAGLGILFGVIAVIVGSVSGSRRLTNAATGGMATLAFAMNSFVPLSDSLAGLAKLSPWYYFNSGDPLANGVDPGQLLVLGAAALVILALGLGVFNRRDLRGWVCHWIYRPPVVYTPNVTKHLIDLDEEALGEARAELGTTTIKDTVNEALRRATTGRERRVAAALDLLADARLDDRADAWR